MATVPRTCLYEEHLRALGDEPVLAAPRLRLLDELPARGDRRAFPPAARPARATARRSERSCAHPQREVRRREQEADAERAVGAALPPSAPPRRRRASGRARARAPHRGRGSRRRTPRRAGRAPGRTRSSPRTAAADDACARRGTTRSPSRPPPRRAPPRASGRRRAPIPARIARKKSRYGCWLGCANFRSNGWTRIAAPPSTTGNASRQSRSASPSPRYAASSGFGRSRGRYGVVPGIAEAERVERLAERPRALLRAAQQRLGVRDGRRPRERGGDAARRGNRPQHAAADRARASLRRRAAPASRRAARPTPPRTDSRAASRSAAAACGRATCRSSARAARSARSSATPRCQPCDAVVSSSEYAPAARIVAGSDAPSSTLGAAVEDRLRGAHGHARGPCRRARDGRARAGRSTGTGTSSRRLGVVHLDRAAKAARELRRHELRRPPARSMRRARPPATRMRRALRRDARTLELVDRDRDRGRTRLRPASAGTG